MKRGLVVGAGVMSIGALLAACEADDDEDPLTEPEADDGVEPVDEPETDDEVAVDDEGDDDTVDVDENDHLNVGWDGDFVSLDPARMRSTLDTELGFKIYSSLVVIETGTTAELRGDLAESWEISDEADEFTFELRSGVQWHEDYGEVTAEDVEYSFMRHLDEDVASGFIGQAEPINEVNVIDDHTVQIVMDQSYPGFALEFCAYRPGFIINQEAVEEFGDRYPESPIGSGPFYLEHWSPDDYVDLVRFDDYYGDHPFFSTVRYSIIPEQSTIEIALEGGDLDIAYFTLPEIQARIEEHPDLDFDTITGPRTWYLQMNMDREPWDDVRVRQALWLGIDKDTLIDNVLAGYGTPSDTLLNPHVFGRLDERVYDYDPDRARELLEEAGYGDGIDALFLLSDGALYSDIGVPLQAMWNEIGVNAEIELREWAQQVETRREGNFDIALQPMLRLGPDQYFTELMHTSSVPHPNSSRYSNAEVDELIAEARQEADDEAREELYHELQRMVHEEVPVIPLFHPVFVLAFHPEIEGAVAANLTINIAELTRSS